MVSSNLQQMFSFYLLLGLSVSLVHGQTFVHIAESSDPAGTDYTGEIRQFSEIGPGGPASVTPRPWVCRTGGVSDVVWQGPGGSSIPTGTGQATGSQLFVVVLVGTGVSLLRGPGYNSPDGEYCCVITATNERRCVTLTTCPMLTPPTYTNGKIMYDPASNVATYGCIDVYAPNVTGAAAQRTCETNNQWTGTVPTVSCLVSCFDLPGLPNGGISYSTGSSGSRPVGTVSTHSCDSGFMFVFNSGNNMRTCQSSGQWSGSAPACELTCPDLTEPANGGVVYSDTTIPREEGSTATYSCDTGYEWSGLEVRTCTGSGWSGSDHPVCTLVDCGSLEDPTNGQVSTTRTTYLGVATYSCDSGYILNGTTTRACLATGQWRSSTPTCAPVKCDDPPPLTNGMVTFTTAIFGSTATYSCDTGYTLNGGSTRTCLANGEWSSSPITCDAVDCGTLSAPIDGAVDTSSGTTFMSMATYSCDTGYIIVGIATRTCEASGNWSSVAPSCDLVPVFLGRMAFTTNNSAVLISDIGEGASALTCHTELTACCREQDNSNGALGEWLGPDGIQISGTNSGSGFYATRQQSSISLNNGGSTVGGQYCCVLPRSGGVITFCVDVTMSTLTNSDSCLGHFVAIAVMLVASAAVIFILVILLIIRTKQLWAARTQLSQLYHNNQQVFETPDQAFYEDVNKMDVGGAGDHTHTPAMELKECPAYAPTKVTQRHNI